VSNLTRRAVIRSAAAAGASAALSPLLGCSQSAWNGGSAGGQSDDAAAFLLDYEACYQPLYTAASEAQWIAATDVNDEHTAAAVKARQMLDTFVGERPRMDLIRKLRERAWMHSPIVNRQIDRAWMAAAHAPGTIPDLVAQRSEAEGNQSKVQDGFVYTLRSPGKPERKVTANDLDDILTESRDLEERRAAWTTSKEIGVSLRPGLERLQTLRNRVGRELGFSSFFGLEVADYGMSVAELMKLMQTVLEQTRPLYEQLHCYARHKLAARYGQSAPRRIPAHWLPNRWGQQWPGLESSADLDPLFKDKTPEWIVQQAERFYVSMGFAALPGDFWRRSDLWELPSTAARKKNRHASAWHINLRDDVRSLMSVKSTSDWFSTAHHELGHIYYFRSYSRPGVPLLLREGANRAFHEAIGDLIALASKQRPYLAEIGLLKGDASSDPTRWLLAEAMDGNIVFQRFACGTMTGFEHDLYEKDLAPSSYNARWWELTGEHQGIEPPAPRGEEFCDAASKTHINDDAASYYDYAIGTLIVYQVHDYIARNILRQDPRSCNYYNRKDVGEYLHALLSLGGTRDWREVLRDFTGEELSARAMLDYYAPLTEFLKKENAGRDVSFS